MNPYVAALIATRPRWRSLTSVALPSLLSQTRLPQRVIIVSDQRPFSDGEVAALRQHLSGIGHTILHNTGLAGVAGAWNTGLAYIRARTPDAFVAILDDDDEWDKDHLEQCTGMVLADRAPVDVVISGLRIVKDEEEITRQPLTDLDVEDFLIGNPGWQGSNTFARVETLNRAGNFTDGLQSLNDRDLAIRLLSLDGISIRFTGRMTSTWHLGREPDALTRPGTPQKRHGIEKFLALHGYRMSPSVMAAFAMRCEKLFDINPIKGT